MAKAINTAGYHIEQIDDFIDKQVAELQSWARGSGFFAISAQEQLKQIAKLSKAQQRSAAVKNMERLKIPEYPEEQGAPAAPKM